MPFSIKKKVMQMNWATLFNPNRIGVNYTKEIDLQSTRSSFAKDYDRILFSAPFRKLQNKTQVFPLTDNIFVHNRLTHSLETASVGKSLGREVGKRIVEKHGGDEVFQHFYKNELQNVVSAACLAHDIGNPPFGHVGEVAISEYFQNLPSSTAEVFMSKMTAAEWDEIKHFEGNANGFRILTHAFNNDAGGEFKQTYATLASMVKYPCRSIHGNDKTTGSISTKKYNVFESEWQQWEQLVAGMQLQEINKLPGVYARHPFVYLTEAADDICYLIIDLEDAHRLNFVSHQATRHHLLGLLYAFEEKKGKAAEEQLKLINADEQKIAYLRALVIHASIMECVNVFMDNEDQLLNGSLNKPLTDLFNESLHQKWQDLQGFSFENIYTHPVVMEREMAGYKVLQGLLEEFINALILKKSHRTKQIRSLIPYAYKNLENPGSLYLNIRSVLDFLSAMTDQEAVKLYRLLKGIEI